MPFHLTITFTGLCAFAFDKPVKLPKGPPTDAWIVMPNILKGMITSGAGGKVDFRQAHYPQLIYRGDAVQGYDPFDLKRSDDMSLLFLYEEELKLLPDGKEQTTTGLDIDNKKPVNPDYPTEKERHSLWWLVEVTDAFPYSAGKMDPRHLDYSPSSTGTVISKLKLTQGTLRTASLSDFPCTFLPPASTEFNQKIAGSLEVSIRFEKYVEFQLPKCGKTLTLRPPHGKNLAVNINNIEIEDFIHTPPRLPADRTRTIDFGVYFALAGLPSDAQLVRSGFQSIIHMLCPPAAFVR